MVTTRRTAVRRGLLATVTTVLTAFSLVNIAPALADTAPVPPVTVPTVSADVLPTVQINGVVWDQVVVGNTVYVTGEFTKARPAGSAAGSNEVTRSNLLAYNLTTGALVTSWAPSLNAAGKAIEASSDGRTIYVGGSFTQVSGVARNRVAALSASTGAVMSWNPNASSRVSSMVVSGGTVYLGGIFTTVSGQNRVRLAAVSASTGALQSWAPTADADVLALVAPAGSGKVVAGGRFATVNGASAYGMAAISTANGALLPWTVGATVRDAGTQAAIFSLSTDGTQVYGTGYVFGAGGNFEGSFAATSSTGAIVYINGCLGDTYDSVPIGQVLYTVGHAHNCSAVGDFPEQNPRATQRAIAQTTKAGAGRFDTSGTFTGQPAPEILHWAPTIDAGSYTGTTQGAWTVEGTSNYVLLGGEFPKINGTGQQGLARMAISSIAPNKQGPQDYAGLTPTLSYPAAGQVTVTWKSSWDRDNRRLTYEVLRGASLGTATVLNTRTQDSEWWNRPTQTFTDATAPRGSSQTYRIRVKDAFGNTLVSATVTGTVP